MPITGVIFDFDGTLLNTTEIIRSSFFHVGETFGISIPPDVVERESGVPLRRSFRSLDPNGNHELMYETFVDFQMHRLNHERPFPCQAYPGVHETLLELWKRRMKLGVFSSRTRTTIQLILKATGLQTYFHEVDILGPSDVPNPKPAPDGLLKLATSWELPCSELLFVGDGLPDVLAAQAAGTPMALAGYGPGASHINGATPTWRIEQFSDLLPIVLGQATPR